MTSLETTVAAFVGATLLTVVLCGLALFVLKIWGEGFTK